MQFSDPLLSSGQHVFVGTKLNGVRWACLGTSWLLAHLQAVVTHGAFLCHANVFNRHGLTRNVIGALRTQLLELFKDVNARMLRYFLCFNMVCFQRYTTVFAAFNHPERTTGDTGSATITDIILDHYGAKFGAEKCARRTNIQTTSVRAVFADIGGHQPTESIGVWWSGIGACRRNGVSGGGVRRGAIDRRIAYRRHS